MRLGPPGQSASPANNPSLLPMLSVMVLTLAFFVVLNSISRVEEEKSKRVLSSVGQTFGNITGSSILATPEGLAAADAAQILQQIFEPMENLATDQVKVRRVLAESLEYRFATAWVFPGTSDRLGPTAANFIAEVRRLLGLRPAQWRYEMEMALTAPDAGEVEFTRAANLAASLVLDDTPDHMTSVAVSPGPREEIVIRISLRAPSSGETIEGASP
jgi:hypothetical protein